MKDFIVSVMNPLWSPDGKQVIFAAKPGEGSDILVGPGELHSLANLDLNPEDNSSPQFHLKI